MGASPIVLDGIDHVVLRTANLDRLVAFYRDVLGCTEERRQKALGLVQMRAGRHLIDLLDARGAPPSAAGNMDHLCVRLAAFEESAIRGHLEALGIPAGETAIRYGADGHGPSIYIEDPDGNRVELKGPPAASP